jgi:hemoglobin-like flavoprotein
MDIQQSLHSILERKDDVATGFYTVFFERYPEVVRYFAEVDLRHQRVLLTMALLIMERNYAHDYPSTAHYLRYLGTKHRGREIPPELYPKFREALLTSLAQFHGADWGPDLARQWAEAIDRTSALMLEGYAQRFTV